MRRAGPAGRSGRDQTGTRRTSYATTIARSSEQTSTRRTSNNLTDDRSTKKIDTRRNSYATTDSRSSDQTGARRASYDKTDGKTSVSDDRRNEPGPRRTSYDTKDGRTSVYDERQNHSGLRGTSNDKAGSRTSVSDFRRDSKPPRNTSRSGSRPPKNASRTDSRPPRNVSRSSSRPPRNASRSSSIPPRNASRSGPGPPENVSHSDTRPPRNLSRTDSRPPRNASRSGSKPPRNASRSGSRPPRNASRSSSIPPRISSRSGSRPPRNVSHSDSRLPRNLSRTDSRPPRNASRSGSKPLRNASRSVSRPPTNTSRAGERSSMNRSRSPLGVDFRRPISRSRSPDVDNGRRISRSRSPGFDHRQPAARSRSPGFDYRRPITRSRSPGFDHRRPVARSRSPSFGNRQPISRSRSPLPQSRSFFPRHEPPPPAYGYQGERHLQPPFASPPPPLMPKYWNPAPRGEFRGRPDFRGRSDFRGRPFVQRGGPSRGAYVGNGFPFYLDQTPPEENPTSSRTLFVGNIDIDMTPDDIKQVFENFGIVEEVRLKDRPVEGGGPGRAFAFVRFFNLNQAYVAKMEMSGKYIGRNRCRIGYGRPLATNCVWIGGIGAWITKQDLEREFGRFGRMLRVVWPRGHDYAYVVYDNVEAAKVAVDEMRGFCFPRTSVRLRMDFSDEDQIDNPPPDLRVVRRPPFERRLTDDGGNSFSREGEGGRGDSRRHDNDERGSRSGGSGSSYSRSRSASSTRSKRGRESESPNNEGANQSKERSERKPPAPKKGRFRALEINLDKVNTLADITDCLPVVWTGQVVIKNQSFHTKLHRVTGRSDLVEDLLLNDMSDSPSLKVTQRLRMDDSKLEEVRKRITKAGSDGWSILVGVPAETENSTNGAVALKPCPFVDLVGYFREKNAAGVLTLPPGCDEGRETGLLHVFPTCDFVHRYLLERAPNFTMDFNDNEYVVMFLVAV